MKNINEIQILNGNDLIKLSSLLMVTGTFYGLVLFSLATNTKENAHLKKAEILAYQAAQIHLMKKSENSEISTRGPASVESNSQGHFGGDRGLPMVRYSVQRSDDGNLRVILNDESSGSPFEFTIPINKAPET